MKAKMRKFLKAKTRSPKIKLKMNKVFDIHVEITRYYGLQKQPTGKWRIFGPIILGESMLN